MRRGMARESRSKWGSRRAAVTAHAGMAMTRRRRRSAIAARSSRRAGWAENEAGSEAEADAEEVADADSSPKSGPRRSRARSAARTSISRARTERKLAHCSMMERSSPGVQSRPITDGCGDLQRQREEGGEILKLVVVGYGAVVDFQLLVAVGSLTAPELGEDVAFQPACKRFPAFGSAPALSPRASAEEAV